jgi:O-antigen biosynthesis protein WbqP
MPFIFLIVIISGIFIKLEENGPVFFKQDRIGKDGRLFKIYKLRSMYVSAPSNLPTGAVDQPDIYIMKVGKFIRRWSIDEIPQVINVFLGNMSFIGPRPLIPEEKEIHQKRKESGVLSIKPGITGWAQVNGRDEITIDEKVRYDVYYMRHQSFLLDLDICLLTVKCVLFGVGYIEGNHKQLYSVKKSTGISDRNN